MTVADKTPAFTDRSNSFSAGNCVFNVRGSDIQLRTPKVYSVTV